MPVMAVCFWSLVGVGFQLKKSTGAGTSFGSMNEVCDASGGCAASFLTGADVGASVCSLLFADSPLAERAGACDVLRAWPPPFKGKSFLAWKFLGLRPRTMMAPDCTSQIGIFPPVASVAITLSFTKKCCCSSFGLPLFAVAILNCSRFH